MKNVLSVTTLLSLISHVQPSTPISLQLCKTGLDDEFIGACNALVRTQTTIPVVELDISSNAFQGPIPWALLATLVHDHGLRRLNLSENNFDVGDGRLPEAQLSGLVGLEDLGLRGLGFSGGLASVVALSPKLQRVDLSNNTFSGEVPVELTRLQVRTFDVASCRE